MNKMNKILIIEDDPGILYNVAEFFREEGFNVYTAVDGVEGIQVALDVVPDIILCDVSMPKKDGFEVCRIIQDVPSINTIPFIFLSAINQKEGIRLGMQLGAEDFLTKPFELPDVLSTVKLRIEKYERIIKQSDERFYSLIDNPMMGVYIYNDNKFMYSNNKLSEISGYKKDEMKQLGFLDIAAAEGNNEAIGLIDRCINGYAKSFHTRLNITRKDNNVISAEIFGCTLKIRGKDCLMGNIMESGKVAGIIPEGDNDLSMLSEREIEVLKLICKGLQTSEIAEKLFVTTRTIDTHRAKIIAKTKSKNTAELVMFAIKNGVINL